jgi:hypothetical protein
MPLCADHLSVESHVFAKIEHFDDLQQVLLDVRGVGEEAGPIRIESKIESVGMGGNIAGASLVPSATCATLNTCIKYTWISVLQPCAPDIFVLLVYDVFDVLTMLL